MKEPKSIMELKSNYVYDTQLIEELTTEFKAKINKNQIYAAVTILSKILKHIRDVESGGNNETKNI